MAETRPKNYPKLKDYNLCVYGDFRILHFDFDLDPDDLPHDMDGDFAVGFVCTDRDPRHCGACMDGNLDCNLVCDDFHL